METKEASRRPYLSLKNLSLRASENLAKRGFMGNVVLKSRSKALLMQKLKLCIYDTDHNEKDPRNQPEVFSDTPYTVTKLLGTVIVT